MMNKLNNKGMTLIELLLAFMITSAIVVSMLNFIMNFQTESITLEKKNEISSYKNVITKLIQTDLIKGEVKNVISSFNVSGNTTTYIFTFNFNKSLSTVKNITSKTLTVSASSDNIKNNYIIYPDVNNKGELQNVRYDIPNITCTGSSCNNNQFTRFSSINTNINDVYNTLDNTGTNSGTVYFDLDIGIASLDNIGDNHIHITAPLNYKYCVVTSENYY